MKGPGVHPASEIVYTIGRAYKKFVAEIGVDDEVSERGTILFSVLGDGKKLFESPMLSGKMQAMRIEIDVTGVQELTRRRFRNLPHRRPASRLWLAISR